MFTPVQRPAWKSGSKQPQLPHHLPGISNGAFHILIGTNLATALQKLDLVDRHRGTVLGSCLSKNALSPFSTPLCLFSRKSQLLLLFFPLFLNWRSKISKMKVGRNRHALPPLEGLLRGIRPAPWQRLGQRRMLQIHQRKAHARRPFMPMWQQRRRSTGLARDRVREARKARTAPGWLLRRTRLLGMCL